MEKLCDYLRISEAAEYLGVSPNTLRNWVTLANSRPFAIR